VTNQAPPSLHRQIAALRAPCTDEERDTFVAFYAHVLADELARADAADAGAIDPDTVERAFIDELLARVRGEAGDLCVVPLPTPAGEDWRVYRFSPSAALPVPTTPSVSGTEQTTATPSVGTPARGKRWALLAVVGGCLMLLGPAVAALGGSGRASGAGADGDHGRGQCQPITVRAIARCTGTWGRNR